ncbi:Dolichyl-diphosphooligosaccharide-protein glycosyltransferase [Clavulina sp. PMI_390]|nr:Dolichyl-diphosphooligosaccharide-protein glycosyltransferase [Clavulina sp. PMI_390]
MKVAAVVGSLFVAGAYALSSSGSSVLVLLEPKLKRDDFSLFFGGLEERGFNLTFRSPKDVAPAVAEFGVPSFDHVILFAPTTKTLPTDLSPQQIVSWLSAPKPVNFLIALSPSNTQLSTLASEFSLSVAPPNTPLLSHFPARDGPHTVIPISASSSPVLGAKGYDSPILYEGTAWYPAANPLIVPILNAPPESVATDTESDRSGADVLVDAADKGGEGLWAGPELQVVTGFQTYVGGLGNAPSGSGGRVVWAGGVSLFKDEFMKGTVATSNAQLAKDVSEWAFQSSNVARIVEANHYVSGDKTMTPRDKYTINTQVTFEIHVQTWSSTLGDWVDDAPTATGAPLEDLQLEFTMLDPHIRASLLPVAGKPGWYSVSFRAPDRHGVFKFLVDWRRKGYTNLHYSHTVSVVPKRHDEYDRFVSAAWPYYAGAISTSIGFIVFSVIYLGGEVDRKTKGKSKSAKAE